MSLKEQIEEAERYQNWGRVSQLRMQAANEGEDINEEKPTAQAEDKKDEA